MKREKIYEICDKYGLDLISTTAGRNGYPTAVDLAVSFKGKSWAEASEIATAEGLILIKCHRRDGWDLWERGGQVYEPFKITAADRGDDYDEIETPEEWERYRAALWDGIKQQIDDKEGTADGRAELLAEIEGWVEAMNETEEKVSELKEGQFILMHNGEPEDICDRYTLYDYDDTHHYLIAGTAEQSTEDQG